MTPEDEGLYGGNGTLDWRDEELLRKPIFLGSDQAKLKHEIYGSFPLGGAPSDSTLDDLLSRGAYDKLKSLPQISNQPHLIRAIDDFEIDAKLGVYCERFGIDKRYIAPSAKSFLEELAKAEYVFKLQNLFLKNYVELTDYLGGANPKRKVHPYFSDTPKLDYIENFKLVMIDVALRIMKEKGEKSPSDERKIDVLRGLGFYVLNMYREMPKKPNVCPQGENPHRNTEWDNLDWVEIVE